jgi:hypothetical protein
MKKYFSIIIVSYLISGNIAAQDGLPINHELWQEKERVIQRNMIPVFTCLKPVPDKLYFSDFLSDTIPNSISAQKKESWLYRKLFKEDLIYVNKDELQFRINPLLDLNLGKEKGSSDLLYRNTRGIRIEGNTSQIITFSSAFYENQAVFPAFIEQKIHDNSVVPGQGLPKVFGKKGKDFAWAEGNLSAKPLKNLILEMGYGKRFFGDGYRSLLLSDYSFVYPYVGYRWCDGNLFMASEVHSYIIPESPLIINSKRFPGKTATLHFLGYQFGHWQISLAETNMYANPDSSGKFHWQAEFFNPLPLINSLAGRGNSMFGLNVRCIPTALLQLYGQFLMDEYDWNHPGKWQSVKNKTGIQLGVKWFEAFTLSHFYIQAEYNEVRPYT